MCDVYVRICAYMCVYTFCKQVYVSTHVCMCVYVHICVLHCVHVLHVFPSFFAAQ